MLENWIAGLFINGVIMVAFGAVAALIAYDLSRERQWSNNPLAAATVVLYISCSGSHGVRALQLLDPVVGGDSVAGFAAQYEYGWLHMSALDALTAFAGIWYWTMRATFPSLVRGTAVFEDLRQRQLRALEINDNIVQGLVEAKLALEMNEQNIGQERLDKTLTKAKNIITDLLGEESPSDAAPQPGGLRRRNLWKHRDDQ